MNFTDLLYDNFIGIFGNVWYHRLLSIILITIYFYTEVKNRFLPEDELKTETEYKEDENELKSETEYKENEDKPKTEDDGEENSSDFILESECDSEESSKSEKTLIKKHFKILKDISSTKFKCKNYSCSYHYYCINDNIRLECCFCKICGNYICSDNTPAPKIMCTHYKLIDSVDSRIDIFSGHIRTDDEEDVRNTINSFFETSDELEMEFHRSRLRQFVYDEVETNQSEDSQDDSDSTSQT